MYTVQKYLMYAGQKKEKEKKSHIVYRCYGKRASLISDGGWFYKENKEIA